VQSANDLKAARCAATATLALAKERVAAVAARLEELATHGDVLDSEMIATGIVRALLAIHTAYCHYLDGFTHSSTHTDQLELTTA
jgi:hypothetical protein